MHKLNCEEALSLLEAFRDNELDSVTSLAVQEHLDDCTACQRRLHWNAEVDSALRRLADATPRASATLRTNVVAMPDRERQTPPGQLRRQALRLAAIIVALVSILSLLYFHLGRSPDVMPFVENHIQSVAKPEPVAIRTSDPKVAERWLKARLSFALQVPHPTAYRLLGARLCKVNNEPVAFLLYTQAGEPLSCFVTRRSQTGLRGLDATARNGIRLGTCEGKNVAAWNADQANYVLVADLPRESLVAFADQSLSGTTP
jgi:anti-sigma factor RsiW